MKQAPPWLKRWTEALAPSFAFVSPSELARFGILGMNRRNHAYIHRYNARRLYPNVDDKLKTKILAKKAGIPAPELLEVVSSQHEVRRAVARLEKRSEFVVKPSKGAAGRGILVVAGRREGRFVATCGALVSSDRIYRHISNILSGLHSIGGVPDVAMIEQRIEVSEIFDGYSFQGLPDVRIIVYKGYPVMAMSRLSTAASGGKANLHQGAVGVGIDLKTGKARSAVQFDRLVERHPDTERRFRDLVMPLWREQLLIAARCHEMTGMGYLGVDVVLDHRRGPLILELNARPGLAIQTANGLGLVPRLERIDQIDADEMPAPEERVAFSQEAFATADALI